MTNGVGSSAPFLMTRSCPPCSQTKRRPSGANAIAVGFARPLATSVSAKPDGSVAAPAGTPDANNANSRRPGNSRARHSMA